MVPRLTSLTIIERMGPDELDLHLTVRIEERPPGYEGILAGGTPGSLRIQVDGRTALRSSPELNDSRTYLATTLADGSLLSINWYEEGATYRSLDDGAIQRIDESLRRVAASLRRRTASDDEIMARLATQGDADGLGLPLCVER